LKSMLVFEGKEAEMEREAEEDMSERERGNV
jgi:hypothetical protein